jgi:glycosyltransferase involved in cell wall biosynthesis
MLLLGRQLTLRGIHCEYWFCKPSNRLAEFLETGRATVGSLSRLAARAERGDFDVIHMTASDEAAPLVSRLAGSARVVVTARGGLAEGWNHKTCFAYTAISEGMADVNQSYTDLEIEVVRNAIDIDRFSPPPALTGGAPIVAFVGRATAPEKDFPRFTRIARRLAAAGARIWIADAHQSSWTAFAGKDVDELSVERWAPVPHAEMPDFYRAVAASGGVVVITSQREGFGNVAPEAAACGARVAAPDVMGLREAMVDGVTGRLFAADASDDVVANMLQQWMESPHDMDACASAARSTYSPSVLADKYVSLYSRTEQKLATHSAREVEYPERGMLLEHLSRQRVWRARAANQAALDYASAGYADLALSALAAGFRASPRQLASRSGSTQFLTTLRQLAGRSAVRRLASRLGKR